MTIKNITIFDLDGTVIDSSHRQATKPDGTLNLEHWFEMQRQKKSFKTRFCLWLNKFANALKKVITP